MTTAIARFIDGVVFALFAGTVAVAGQAPQVEGDLLLGLSVAGALNLVLFAGLLWLLFRSRNLLSNETAPISRFVDWLAARFRGTPGQFRASLAQGILWPRGTLRQTAVLGASIVAKGVSATHFLWAGLAVGITLEIFDYLFLMVFAGFAMVLSRFIRLPGGFVVGTALALKLLGVADEQALAMVLFNHVISTALVVSIGLIVLWQNGIDIRELARKCRSLTFFQG